MSSTIEAQGRTVDEAIQIALNLLGASRDKVEIEIVHHPRRGFLGIGARRAKVRATLRKGIMLDGEEFDMSRGALQEKPRRRRRRGGRGRNGRAEGEQEAASTERSESERGRGREGSRGRRGERQGAGDSRQQSGRGRDERRGREDQTGARDDQRGRGDQQRSRDEARRSGEQQRGRGESRDRRQSGGGGSGGQQGGRGRGGAQGQEEGSRRDSMMVGGPAVADVSAEPQVARESGPQPEAAPETVSGDWRVQAAEQSLPAAELLDPTAIREKAQELVTELVAGMGFPAEVKSWIDEISHEVVVSVHSESEGLLIGRRGQTLDALEHVVNRMVLRGDAAAEGRVLLDIGDYRRRRRDALVELAERLRARALGEKRSVQVSPMSPRDRKFFQQFLSADSAVEVRAVGAGFYRRMIVAPAGMTAAELAEAETAAQAGQDEESSEESAQGYETEEYPRN